MELRIPQSKYKVITILTKSKTLNTNSHIDDCIYIFKINLLIYEHTEIGSHLIATAIFVLGLSG